MFFLLFFVSVYYVYQQMVNKKFNIYILATSISSVAVLILLFISILYLLLKVTYYQI